MRFLRFLLMFFIFIGVVVFSQGKKEYSLLEEFLKLPVPPVLQYSWDDGANEELTEDLVKDYLRMGFTGIQNKCSPRGGKYFLHGYLPTFGGTAKVPYQYRDTDGKIKNRYTAFGDICAPENVDSLVDRIEETIKIHGDTLFRLGKYYFMMTGDEVDMQYGRTAFNEVSRYREKAWQEYVRNYYGDKSPGQDTNGDGRMYNRESITPVENWEDISLPSFENRFKEPILWNVYRDFHSFVFYNFFRKVEKKCEERGIPVLFGMNGHGSISHPAGRATMGGASYWYQATMDRFFGQENVFANWPVSSTLAFSTLNRMSKEYKKPVFAWSWFWPGWRGSSGISGMSPTDEIERFFALIFGNEVHLLLYWVYCPLYQRIFPETQTIAFWHHWFQNHWDFLKNSHPVKPDVAILYPTRTGYFYGMFQYPAHNYIFFPQALMDLHIPFTVITEEEIEHRGVGDYKVLYVVLAERVSEKTAREIERFIQNGGMVFSDGDSLSMDISGRPLNLLEERFGVKLAKKYKVYFNSSILSAEEEKWVEAKKKGEDAHLPQKTPYGIEQVEFDLEGSNIIEMKIPWSIPSMNTYNDVVTGRPTEKSRVLATFNGEPVMIETDNTVWVGFHPGADIYATFPRQRILDGAGPVAPYWGDYYNSAYQRAGYTDVIGYICEKAGVRPPVKVLRNGQTARNINVYTRIHKETGTVLIILIDFDLEVTGAPDRYIVEYPSVKPGFVAWDLTENKQLKWQSKGTVEVVIPEHRTKYIVMGPPSQVKKMADIQKKLLAMNLQPEPFRSGPRGGIKEPELPSVRISGIYETIDNLPEDTVVRILVKVTNPDRKDKLCEPIILKGADIGGLVPSGMVRSVKVAGHTVQWDDFDKDGYISSADEIVWQANLPARKTTIFEVDFLHSVTKEVDNKNEFSVKKHEDGSLEVVLEGRKIFGLNKYGEWVFENSSLGDGNVLSIGEQTGFVFEVRDHRVLKEPDSVNTEVVADGPVRKVLRARFSYKELEISSTTDFTVYRQQLEDENRIYAYAIHSVDKELNFPEEKQPDSYLHSPTNGGLLTLVRCRRFPKGGHWKNISCYYEDSLGRLSITPSAYMENNFGGWIAVHYPSDGLLQVSLKRVKGIVEGENILDEADGLQVGCGFPHPYRLMRAAVNQSPENPLRLVDTRIEAGTRWKLDTLISIRRGFDENRCRETRKGFASPPIIEIERVLFSK